ncbi:hypothetical protein B0H13DRAFT_2059132 [Mycena leptocephala]|nr:hypothetical protein B0H13DRAFT_2059132 [Mycena leptocephala]
MDLAGNSLLPVELERDLFELAAFLHPECMLALVLVARRVKIWIKPMLYETISVHQKEYRRQFSRRPLRAVAELIISQPAALRYHTRHLCLVNVRMSNRVVDLLSRCGVLDNLAFIKTYLGSAALLPILGLCRFGSFQLFPWPNPFDGGHSLFSQITHLGILDKQVQVDDWRTWSGLAQIPRLTHLSALSYMSESVSHGVLKHCKFLEVLVFICNDQEQFDQNQARAELTDDPRFVMLVVTDRLSDWEMGARGGEDYWVRASALVRNVDLRGNKVLRSGGAGRTHWARVVDGEDNGGCRHTAPNKRVA